LRRVEELDALDLDSADFDQIEDYFRGMDTLIKQHCEPIGLGVMIHTLTAISLLGMILEKWTGDDQPIGMLLSGIPGNRTFDANLETWRLSRKVEGSAVLKDIFSRYPSDQVISELKAGEEGKVFGRELEAFLKAYDFRGAEDREISFPRWGDDPTLLVDVIKIFLQAGDEADPEAIEKSNIERREEKTKEIIRTLGSQSWGFFKKGVFKFLLRYAQVYSLFRENQRYEIDRVFYGERKAFLAASKRLLEMGLISNPDDIWFLSKEEAFDALRGKKDSAGIMKKVVSRRAEYRRYMYNPPLMFLQGDREFDVDADGEMDKKDEKAEALLTGMAASPGKTSGEARVLHNIRELTRIKPGDILITNSTDPGWTPVFLLIRGLVLETGGVLAHGTILSREYGLPAVTSVKNATNLIKDGDIITIDGDKGFITLGART
jgi:pyruvate,water dikinase